MDSIEKFAFEILLRVDKSRRLARSISQPTKVPWGRFLCESVTLGRDGYVRGLRVRDIASRDHTRQPVREMDHEACWRGLH